MFSKFLGELRSSEGNPPPRKMPRIMTMDAASVMTNNTAARFYIQCDKTGCVCLSATGKTDRGYLELTTWRRVAVVFGWLRSGLDDWALRVVDVGLLVESVSKPFIQSSSLPASPVPLPSRRLRAMSNRSLRLPSAPGRSSVDGADVGQWYGPRSRMLRLRYSM